MNINNIKKLKAFTLAEALIVVLIIGIIAALTIPTLRNNSAKRIAAAQLNKAIEMITDAAQLVIAEENGKDEDAADSEQDESERGFYYTTAGVKASASSSDQGVQYFLDKYFKHASTDCVTGKNQCVGSSYKNKKNDILGALPTDFYCIKTVNNTAICMRYDEEEVKIKTNKETSEGEQQEETTTTVGVVKVLVDINAADKPNITGTDLFVMKITNDGFLEDLNSDPHHCGTSNSSIIDAASGCYTKILMKEDN